MAKREKSNHVYIFDYFLDGAFLKWEEVDCQFPVCGQRWLVNLENGTEIVTKIVAIEQISENEHRVFLSS